MTKSEQNLGDLSGSNEAINYSLHRKLQKRR
jgi:hypothetical protein